MFNSFFFRKSDVIHVNGTFLCGETNYFKNVLKFIKIRLFCCFPLFAYKILQSVFIAVFYPAGFFKFVQNHPPFC